MHYPDKASVLAEMYFKAFSRLFGKTPNFPSGEERKAAFDTMKSIINDKLSNYGDDPEIARTIDIAVLDFMEELINSYE